MNKEQIMIVEDDIVTAKNIQLSLERMGYTITALMSAGEQAIQKIENEGCPDLVLMDISLQGKLDGIETSRILNSKFDVPVIFLTSHVEESIFEESKSTNPYGYLTKPFKEDELHKAIELGLYRHKSDEDRRMLVTELKKEIVTRNRIERELEMRVRQQDVIALLGHNALSRVNPIDFMHEVVKKVAYTLDNEFCKVLKLLPDGADMLLLAGTGWVNGLVGHTKVDTSLKSQAGYTLHSSKPVIVNDLKTDARFSGSKLLIEHKAVSGMSIVIHGKDGPWGILSTHSTKHKNFSKDDVNFLHSVANLLASTIARRKADDMIKESEEKYRKLIETAHDTIISFDERGIINICNQMAVKTFGYPVSEIIGQPITTIIPDIYKNERQIGMSQFLNLSISNILDMTIELSGNTKAGTEFPIEVSLSYQKTKDKKYISTAIIRDITFQIKAKEQLIEKSKEIEKINKELKDFVYTVSHDLKEPLFSINGYITRLYETYQDMYDEKGRRFSNRIMANIEIMSSRIQEILEVAKIGMITYDFKINASKNIVNNVLASLEDQISSNNINTIINNNLPAILCDEKRIRDVFYNLVTNAIKFMGDDKQRQITIGCDNNNNCYKFFVEDTGIGIRKEYQEHVFRIFSRLKEIETEGTGVGLIIVKKIVELHKGKIWIESPVVSGKGTRFCFTLPNDETITSM